MVINLKKAYEQPRIDLEEVTLEESIVTASIVTDKSVTLITEEEILTDTKEWTFD